jgi:hypothetical protein
MMRLAMFRQVYAFWAFGLMHGVDALGRACPLFPDRLDMEQNRPERKCPTGHSFICPTPEKSDLPPLAVHSIRYMLALVTAD